MILAAAGWAVLSQGGGAVAAVEMDASIMEGGGLANGAGAVALAAIVNRRAGLEGKTTVLLLGGGNIDVNLIARIIERGLVKDGRIVRLTVLLRDRPGSLARLTGLVAEASRPRGAITSTPSSGTCTRPGTRWKRSSTARSDTPALYLNLAAKAAPSPVSHSDTEVWP